MSKFKQFCKEKWAWIAAAFVVIGGIIAAVLSLRPSGGDGESLPTPVQKAKEKLQKDLSKARIDAAVEIATARGEEKQVKKEIEKIIETTSGDTKEDKKKQLDRLAALANSTRRRR